MDVKGSNLTITLDEGGHRSSRLLTAHVAGSGKSAASGSTQLSVGEWFQRPLHSPPKRTQVGSVTASGVATKGCSGGQMTRSDSDTD